jgi:4-azaleucine resistance transporter AzlC
MTLQRSTAAADFRLGFTHIAPVLVAMVPIAILWGTLAAKAGLSPLEAGLMSISVFAGASQFVAIGLWDTPVPVTSILVATFLVNLRHVMMGASIARRMEDFTLFQKLLALYPLADENWALAEQRARSHRLTPAYYAGLSLFFPPLWTLSTVIGAYFGNAMGDPAQYGFDFIFSVIFIALIIGFRSIPGWAIAVIASAAVATATYQFLPSPWYILAGAIAGMLAAAAMAKPAKEVRI